MECLQGTTQDKNKHGGLQNKNEPREKMQREDGKVPNGRQLCSKSSPGSELGNSTADICIRTWPHSPFFSLSVLQILRHPRPAKTPPNIPKTAGSYFIKLPQPADLGSGSIDIYTRCCSANARCNLSRGIPSVGLIPSLKLVQIWDDCLSFYPHTGTRHSRNRKYSLKLGEARLVAVRACFFPFLPPD